MLCTQVTMVGTRYNDVTLRHCSVGKREASFRLDAEPSTLNDPLISMACARSSEGVGSFVEQRCLDSLPFVQGDEVF